MSLKAGESKFEGEAEREVPERTLTGWTRTLFAALALATCLFVLYSAATVPLENLKQRSLFLALVFSLGYLVYPMSPRRSGAHAVPWYDYLFLALTIWSCLHIFLSYDRIMLNPGESTDLDMFLGVVLVLSILELTRRVMGLAFPIIAGAFILYSLLGRYVPGFFAHRGFDPRMVMETLYLTTNGIWGILLAIMSVLVAMFVIFGSLILYTGAGDTFIDLSLRLAGRRTAGPAQIATIASALFGMINGSPSANVATTGNFTIPMMKRLNYGPELSAAVEATASSGGQITPPIMGAGAFVMAELLGISYLHVCLAAAIPAGLFYLGTLSSIHFEGKVRHLATLEESALPPWAGILKFRRLGPIFIPLAVLLGLLFRGYSADMSVFWSVAILFGLHLAMARSWAEVKARLLQVMNGLIACGRGLVLMTALIACAQIVVSMINLTGVGVKLSWLIISAAGGNVFIALVLAALVCMVLGMGVPTTAAYVIAASVLGPALSQLKILDLAAHLFLFYYSALSTLTPPVCAGVFVAAGLAGAQWLKTAFLAMRLAAVKYIVPFFWIYDTSLLFLGGYGQIVRAALSAGLGAVIFSAGSVGWLNGRLSWLERIILISAGLLLIKPGWETDLMGLAALAGVWLFRRTRAKTAVPHHPKETA